MSGSGDVVAAGAPGYYPYNQTPGTVEVYERSASTSNPTDVQNPKKEINVQAFFNYQSLIVKYALTGNVKTYENIRMAIYDVMGKQILIREFRGDKGIIEISLSAIGNSKLIYVVFQVDDVWQSDKVGIPVLK